MKSMIRFFLIVSFFAARNGVAVPPPVEGAAGVDAAWMKAFKANDLEAVMACYAADAVAWLPDAAGAQGTQAIRETYRAFFADNTIQDVTLSDTHYQTVGNRSVGWGRFTMTLVPKATGKPAVATGRYTEVVEKRGGKWVYTVDHASMDPPPAATPASKQ